MFRLKYLIEWFFFLFIFSSIAILQVTFISSLPPIYFSLNLVLISLLFSLISFKKETTFTLAVLMGFWLDILNFNFFGLHIFVLLLTIFIIDFLLHNWLTNRSLYSFLVLSVISVLIYNILLYSILAIWQSGQSGFNFFLLESRFWNQLIWQIIWSSGFMILFFSLANSLSRHLKPFFLEKK
jgi:rod shape-determining protein MreD